VTETYGHHRTPWFERILQDISRRLQPALGRGYTPLFLTCTGLGGREAAVANLVRTGDRVIATPGDFERLARAWGADVRIVPAHSLDEGGVDRGRVDAVLIEHVSANGALVDIGAVVRAVRTVAPQAPIVLDASISFAVDFTDVQTSGVDAVLIVPERGLMGIPGLTIVAVTDAFMEVVAVRRPDLVEKPFLFDLLRHHRAWGKHTTPFSPNISACVALQAALEEIDGLGGLGQHQQGHAARAAAIRDTLDSSGIRLLTLGAPITNASTSCAFPAGVDVSDALRRLRAAGIDARRLDPDTPGVEIAHAGYLSDSALQGLFQTIALFDGCGSAPEVSVPDIASSESLPCEPPFAIAPREFAEQVDRQASRAIADERVRAKVIQSAKRVFRDRHAVHEDAVRHRVVGFVGAGRIARAAAALCRKRGIENLLVYSPSLAEVKSGRDQTSAGADRFREWSERGVGVAGTLEELFGRSHTVVLLPVPYDDAALKLFRKPARYHNHGLVSAELLDCAHRAGRLDLVINAAARGALVDRRAVAAAVGRGWLRYYSDEMPSADNPLLDLEETRFTAHVGGSCRAPQAAVARNTHTILRRLIARMLETTDSSGERDDYQLSVVNAHLLGHNVEARLANASRDLRKSNRIRILLTDRFDIGSLAFQSLEELGIKTDVHDISDGSMSSERLIRALSEIRPHIVMLRSRTGVDAAAAEAMVHLEELAFVIRPGVGVDNLYGGLERLSAAGVQVINEPYGNSAAVAEMALHFILSGTGTTLLAPGPTKFNAEVFDVASLYDSARLSEPTAIAAHVNKVLGTWLGARSDAITLSGPGTALMEASIANVTLPGSRGLVLSHGKFGDRFVEIAQSRGRACEVLRVPEEEWGKAITPDDVSRYLEADAGRASGQPFSFLCVQQNETSSGVTYHQKQIRELVRVARACNPNMMLIVDAISGALAHRLDFQALDVDVLFLGSQKALGVSSGLAFAVLSDRALRWMLTRAGYAGDLSELARADARDRFLDELDRLQHVHSISLLRAAVGASNRQPVDTPSVFHLLSTERALALFEDEGGPAQVADRHAELARLAREGIRQMGLELMAAPPFESDSVTVVLLPAGLDASTLRKSVARSTGIAIAGAQGDFWKPRMLRIGTLGFVTQADVARCLRALEVALADAGWSAAIAQSRVAAGLPIPVN